MARLKTTFFCTECGNEYPGWLGQCPACGAWNTLTEAPRVERSRPGTVTTPVRPSDAPIRLREVEGGPDRRWQTGMAEFDFVLGGGIVPGSLILVGGEPGIGKSTLLLQVAALLEAGGRSALYVSGEESAQQVRLRADRLREPAGGVTFLGENRLSAILETAERLQPAAIFVDSIQTVLSDDAVGLPGSISQVRHCAAALQRHAKEAGVTVFLVGHVTKGGVVAGPRTLEHIVDTVIYFEDGAELDYRVLRATKNRFGSVAEIGVFRMTQDGLEPVDNPSSLFLQERLGGTSGAAVAAVLQGTRPLLVEVQALCAAASYGAPQRVANGFDRQRLAMLLAVLEKRAGAAFAERDVFLNVVGGLRIQQPAADLAVAAALLSGALECPVPSAAVFIGEIGLGGELRGVGQLERRLGEAARMGFARAFVPGRPGASPSAPGITIAALEDVRALWELLTHG